MHEIDLEANEMLESIITRLAAERGIDENLKARDMLRWVAELTDINEREIFSYAFKLGMRIAIEVLTD